MWEIIASLVIISLNLWLLAGMFREIANANSVEMTTVSVHFDTTTAAERSNCADGAIYRLSKPSTVSN
jgi:hypothetical protein